MATVVSSLIITCASLAEYTAWVAWLDANPLSAGMPWTRNLNQSQRKITLTFPSQPITT